MRVAKSAFGILCHLVMRAAFGGLDPKLTLAAAGSKALFGPFTSSKISKYGYSIKINRSPRLDPKTVAPEQRSAHLASCLWC